MFCRRCKTVDTVTNEFIDLSGKRHTYKRTVVRRGRMYVDRVFSENMNYELVCLTCGVRRFIGKNTVFGQWLHVKEEILRNAASGQSV